MSDLASAVVAPTLGMHSLEAYELLNSSERLASSLATFRGLTNVIKLFPTPACIDF